jgi:AsmA protein
MKIIRWVTMWVLAPLVAVTLIAAGLLAWLVTRIDVRAEVERAVEGATGRDLTISGDVGVSYWPTVGVHAAGAALANVEGGRAPAFLTAEDIHVGVELWPLVNRRVVVRRLVLQQPRIALEVDANGAPNWLLGRRRAPQTAPAAPPPSAPRPPAPAPTLRALRIDNGEISFFDARRGSGWVVGAVDIESDLTRLDQPMRIAGEVLFNEKPVALDIDVARPGAALRGALTPLKLSIESELLNFTLDGATIAASGEVQGTVSAAGPSLRQLAAWTGIPFQGGVGLEHFSVSGRLAIGGGRYDFSNASVALDRISGRGDFVLSQHAGKPYLSGRLQLADFDLNPYLIGQAPPPAPAEAASRSALAVVEAPARAVDVETAPSQAPIDFAGLRAFNADLELITGAVLVQHMRVDSARLNMVIHDGRLAATLHEMALYGGSGRGRVELDARGPAPSMLQELALTGLDASRFLGDAANFKNIEGRAEISLNLRTQGRNQSEMIAAADGEARIAVNGGTLIGVDLGGVSRTIRNALRGELIAPEARTPFQGFSASFAIADGVLASEDLSFATADLRLPGIGVIDLPARRLDVRLAARSPRGGIAVPFSIRGPWGQFAYRYDGNQRAQGEILARVRAVKAQARRAQP